MKFDIPVFLFEHDSAGAMGFARTLARCGVPVYFVNNMVNEAFFSKYFKKCEIISDMRENVEGLLDYFSRIKDEFGFSVIVPGSDISCLRLAQVRRRLNNNALKSFHFLMPSDDVLNTLVNKRLFYRSLSEQKIAHPQTFYPKSLEELRNLANQLTYPVLIKPCYSQMFSIIFKIKGFFVKSKEDLIQKYSLAIRNKMEVFIQELIPGFDNQVFGINAYFSQNSKASGLFAYQKLRGWPRKLGYASLIESISLSEIPLVDSAIEYLENLGYHGLADIEFLRDSRDGEFKFLEVNPRVWLQNSFPEKCGINLNLMAYLDAINKRCLSKISYDVGKKWISCFDDFSSAKELFYENRIGVSDWLGSLGGLSDWNYLPSDDMLPWIRHFAFKIRYETLSLFRKLVN